MLSFTILAASANAAVEISDGSVKALYHFDGDGTDSSGNGFNLTENGSVAYASGVLSTSTNLITSGAFFSRGSLVSASTSDISIFAWVYVSSTNERGGILLNGDPAANSGNGNGYGLGIGNGGGANTDTPGNNLIGTIGAVSWADWGDYGSGGWHHVGFTRNSGGTWRSYVDSIEVANSADVPNTPSNNFVVGKAVDNVTHRYFRGRVDELVFTAGVLSTSTIQALYNSGNGAVVCVTPGCGSGSGSSSPTSTTDLGEVTAPLGVVDLVIDFIALLLGISAIWYYKRR